MRTSQNAPAGGTNVRPRAHRAWGWIVLTLVYGVLVLPMILTGANLAAAAWDESEYHLPIITTMRDQWPSIDVVHYDSATTPGYHVLMAAVLKLTGSVAAVRLASALLSWGLIMAAYSGLRCIVAIAGGRENRAAEWACVALTLPLVFSQYFLGAAIWLTTDNTALLVVVLSLASIGVGSFSGGRTLCGGVFAALAVLVRQLHVWLAAPIVLAGVLASPLAGLAPKALRRGALQAPRSWRRMMVSIAASALPIVALGTFVLLWGSLVPVSDKIRQQHLRGANPATLAFTLALAGALGAFMLTLAPGGVWSHIRRLLRSPAALGIAVTAGLAAGVLFPTAWAWRVRDTGLWLVVKHTPVVMNRSILLALMSAAGAVVVLALYRRAAEAGRGATALFLLLSLLAWVAAQTANIMCWHRYFEPLLLVVLGWIGLLGADFGPAARKAWAWRLSGPLVLAAMLLAVSAWTLYRPEWTGASRMQDVEGTAWKYRTPQQPPDAEQKHE